MLKKAVMALVAFAGAARCEGQGFLPRMDPFSSNNAYGVKINTNQILPSYPAPTQTTDWGPPQVPIRHNAGSQAPAGHINANRPPVYQPQYNGQQLGTTAAGHPVYQTPKPPQAYYQQPAQAQYYHPPTQAQYYHPPTQAQPYQQPTLRLYRR